MIVVVSDGGLVSFISSALASYNTQIADLGESNNFVYALRSQYLASISPPVGAQSYLIKLDRESLEIIEEIPLGLQFAAMSIIDDSNIKFARGATFYSWDGQTVTTLGTVSGVDGAPNFVNGHLVYQSDVFFYGSPNGSVNRIAFSHVGDCIALSKIARDISKKAALRESQFDVTELIDCVPGYGKPRRSDGKTVLAPLQGAYHFDAVESDGKIKYRKRGRSPVATILQEDMAAHEPGAGEEPDAIIATQRNERELPQRMEITYLQRDKDYEPGNQYDERLITESRKNATLDFPISLGNDTARQVVAVVMAEAWTSRNQVEFQVSRKYARLEPTDTANVEI